MSASTVPNPAAKTATPTRGPVAARTRRMPAGSAAPAGSASPSPTLSDLYSLDLAAYARRLGAEFRADPLNAHQVRALVWARRLGLDGYDPDDRIGLGYRVYCGLMGGPDEPGSLAPYPLHRVPSEVVEFWKNLITEARSRTEVMMVANHPAFATAFVDAVTA